VHDLESHVNDGTKAPLAGPSSHAFAQPSTSSHQASHATTLNPKDPAAAGTIDGTVDSSDEEGSGTWLAGRLKWLELNPAAPRFVGKASPARLIKNALDIRSELTPGSASEEVLATAMRNMYGRRPEYWSTHPVRSTHIMRRIMLTPSAVGEQGC
jgi:hypothetical protein